MPIDDCDHDFMRLARKILPDHMRRLRAALKSPVDMKECAVHKQGPKALARTFGLDGDFPGCYVLLRQGKPIYVGISRGVLNRLGQHAKGTTHYTASLAYQIAVKKHKARMTRNNRMADEGFKRDFDKARKYIRGLKAAYVRIDNPLELYLFEAYASMKLDTSKWNTFETH